MLALENQLETLRQWSETTTGNVLSIYADVNPALPENKGKGWLKRIKNTLKELPEIHDHQGKRDQPLYDRVMELLGTDRPQARTLALFAHRDEQGRLHAERLDLHIELPVVDLASGRVEVRYGKPYLTPLWFAVDEYQRTGILVLETTGRWRLFEAFLGEIREDEDALAAIAADDWATLKEASSKISAEFGARAANPGGRYDKLSPREREAARVSTWMRKFYGALSRLFNQWVDRLAMERLVLVGEQWQISHFETYLSRRLQQRLTARLPLLPEARRETAPQLWRRIEPVLLEAERQTEMKLLDEIREQPGLWGLDPVLDALQLGRVRRWVLPWSLELTIWRCPQDGYVAATREALETLCDHPESVPLRDHILDLSADFGAEIKFVRGGAEQRLVKEMGAMAALLRW